MIRSELVETLVSSAAPAVQPALRALDDLPTRLSRIVTDARSAWPSLEVPNATFVAYLAARLPTDRSAAAGLDGLRPGDLFLACACASGDGAAIARFEGKYVSDIGIALSRMRLSASALDEVRQLIRQRLFVGPTGGPGKIIRYSGRGDLGRWVRALAVRTCLNHMRKGRREIAVDDSRVFDGLSSRGDDPELKYIKERYRTEFREAFEHAIAHLSDREQNLLRYHHVDSLNIDEIGAIYRVHRVTAYRWLEKARDNLVQQTLETLRSRLNVERREVDSILRLIRSQIHLSLHRYFAVSPAPSHEDDV